MYNKVYGRVSHFKATLTGILLCICFLFVSFGGGISFADGTSLLEAAAENIRNNTSEPAFEPLPEGDAPILSRQNGMYTFLLAGIDQISGSTDTIMVARLDSINHTVNVVSLPRDTLLNVEWDSRRLNSVYAGSLRSGGDGISDLLMQVRRLTGIDIDYYAIIDLNVFIEIVDTMGGIYFDVPFAMDYDEYYQELFIHLEPGYQLLNGYQVMGLCRFRADYSNGDIGRIDMQHAFLQAAMEQYITLGNIPNAKKAIEIASQGTVTNLSAGNIAWLIGQALQCDSDDIHFYTMPCGGVTIRNTSYVSVFPYQWLQMINEVLNPYDTEIGYGNLDIVFLGSEGFQSTTYVAGEWYYEEPEEEKTVTVQNTAPAEEGWTADAETTEDSSTDDGWVLDPESSGGTSTEDEDGWTVDPESIGEGNADEDWDDSWDSYFD